MKKILTSSLFVFCSLSGYFVPTQNQFVYSQESLNNQQVEFYCGKVDGVPTTIAFIEKEKAVGLISWLYNYSNSSSWIPEDRCQVVSERLQRLSNQGKLNYLTTGYINGYPIICSTRSITEECSEETIVWVLQRGSDVNEALKRLFSLNVVVNSDPLNEEASALIKFDNKLYLHIESLLDTTPRLYGDPIVDAPPPFTDKDQTNDHRDSE